MAGPSLSIMIMGPEGRGPVHKYLTPNLCYPVSPDKSVLTGLRRCAMAALLRCIHSLQNPVYKGFHFGSASGALRQYQVIANLRFSNFIEGAYQQA